MIKVLADAGDLGVHGLAGKWRGVGELKMVQSDLHARILAVIGESQGTADAVAEKFEAWSRDTPDLYSIVIGLLWNIDLAEAEAKQTLLDLVKHQQRMEDAVGRHVDLRVAAMDYLVQHPGHVNSPTIIDKTALDYTRRLAAFDEVTGLYNRHFLEDYLDKEMNRARRYDQAFAILFLDLDDFKRINDSKGHAVGDRVLSELGRKIAGVLRHEDFAARYGGEEFTVVLPQTTADGAFAFGERLRKSIVSDELVPDVRVTLSGGVASYPRHGLSVDAVLRQADRALYAAKLAGKNRILVSTADKRSTTRYRADFPAVVYAGSDKIGPLRLCDVSTDGYSLVSDDNLEPGQILRVRVYAKDGSGHVEHDIFANVVWSRRVAGERVYRVGGRWDPPRSDVAARIVREVSQTAAG